MSRELLNAFRMFAAAVAFLMICTSQSTAQTLSSSFSGYTLTQITNLGGLSTITGTFGGLTLKSGDLNTLLIVTKALSDDSAIHSVGVNRDSNGHITGFQSTASKLVDVASLGSGLAYHPAGNVLFATKTTSSTSELVQIATNNSIIRTDSMGNVTPRTGSVNFVPSDYLNAGQIRITSFGGSRTYTGALTQDSGGFAPPANFTQVDQLSSTGPEGIAWVPFGSSGFTNPSGHALVNEQFPGRISAYQWNDNSGTGVLGARVDFITGFNSDKPFGGFIDPLTGDYLFTTYDELNLSNSRIFIVQGFAPVPEPTGILAASAGVGLALSYLRRRRRMQLTQCQPAVA